ncbi:MAG: hydrogenase maturation protease [bacterium]
MKHIYNKKREILVYGLGNEVKRDDAIGPAVVRRVEQTIHPEKKERFHFVTGYFTGWNLMEVLRDYEEVVIVEGIVSGLNPPGTVVEFTGNSEEWKGYVTPRFLEVLNVGKIFPGMACIFPQKFTVFAVEVHDIFTYGYDMTAEVENHLPTAVRRLQEFLEGHDGGAGKHGGQADIKAFPLSFERGVK